jgi:TPR repeat protein
VKARFDKESVPTDYNLAVADAALSVLQRPSAKKLLSLGIENYKSATPARVREGASQMEQACLGGEWVGCQWAGNRYRKGEGVSQNPTRAIELYTMGCDRDVYSACWELGLMLVDEDTGLQDMDRAWRVLDHACAGGHESSCAKTGRMLLNGEGTPADTGKGYARLEPLCAAGNGTACSHMAWGIRKGQGTAKDMRRALGYYEKGCDLEYAHACNEAGYLLDAGEGNVAEDNTKGTALYAKGCELGNAMACDNAGEQYKGGDGVSQSSSRAKTYFEKACSLGKQDSCKK